MVLLIPLEQPQSHTSTVRSSLTPTQPMQPLNPSEQTIPIYAMIILSLALVVLIAVCTVTASLICYSCRQRWLLKSSSKTPNQEDEESVTSKTSKQKTDGPSITNTHSRKIRRSKSSVQLLMQKASEKSRQNQQTKITRDHITNSKPNLRRSRSLPDLTDLIQHSSTSSTAPLVSKYTSPTNITSKCSAQVARVKPISHRGPTHTPNSSEPKLTDEILNMKLDNWRKSRPSQTFTGGDGWYERHKSRQIALASYAQLYLVAGAKTPEPGVSPSTKL